MKAYSSLDEVPGPVDFAAITVAAEVTREKPVVLSVWVTGEVKNGDLCRKLEHNHMIPYPTPDRAARAPSRLVQYSEYLGVARRMGG